MKRISLLLGFLLLTSVLFSQESWERVDTCRLKVTVDARNDLVIEKEDNPRFTEFLDLLFQDHSFCNVEDLRAYLDLYDFRSVRLDIVDNKLVFYFEKIVKETYERVCSVSGL